MTEYSDLLERLQDLRGLSKRKKYQLAKHEKDEVLAVLSSLCTMDEEGYQATIEALSDFPSDLGAMLLADAWSTLMDAKLSVPRHLRDGRFNTDLGKRLRISLAQRLLSKYPDPALRVLLDVCKQMKPAKKPVPTMKDLGLLRTALIEPAGQSLGKLPMTNAMASELSVLATYLIAAAFTRKKSQKSLSAQLQLAIVRWANGYSKLGQLPPEVARAMAQDVRTWDGDYRAILAEEVGTYQATLREVLEPVCGMVIATEKPQPLKEPAAEHPDVHPAEVRPAEQSSHYDALYEIGRLAKYVQSLEKQLKQSRQSLQNAEQDWQLTQNELRAARGECEETRRQLAVERDSSSRLADEKNILHKEIESLRKDVGRFKSQLEAILNQHKETVAAYEKQLDALSERIAREGERRITAFRNKLGARVQPYAEGLKDAENMQMTEELGTALRNELRQLLMVLKTERVRINGDL